MPAVQNAFMLLAAVVGAGLAAQAAVNAQLRAATGSALWTALISSSLTVALLGLVQLAQRDPLSLAGASRFPWWIWTGGVAGASYVFAVVVLTRPLGVALLFAAVVVGQLGTGLVIDHFGWFNVAVHPVSPARLIGAALLLAGLGLIRFF